MAVYVDDADIPFGRMIMCHMIADTRKELDEMAIKIGVAIKWRQKSGTYKEHFDVCKSAKEKALESGAIEIDGYELSRKMISRNMDEYLGLITGG